MHLPPSVSDPKLLQLLEEAKARVERMTPEERSSMYAQQRRSYVLAEIAFGSDKDEAAYREALANNDRATLRRLDAEADARVTAAEGYLDQALAATAEAHN